MTKDSRLERFLKGLCSLDYSDLPKPLSRVEVLWNCLVTGEAAPDFQPQSRTEKYLMTILGVYDLEDIPQPISRAEMLLYKLATGDTDVELEGGAKSRYERLLSEIVANCGVGGVGFEYVTYVLSGSYNTLYNTVEKSVKSAILTGCTLVNLVGDYLLTSNYIAKINHKNIVGKVLIKNIYKGEQCYVNRFDTTTDAYMGPSLITSNNFILEIPEGQYIGTVYDNESVITADELLENAMIIKYQDGMENWDIPYFEGMQSVKMPVLTTTGKNLFDVSNLPQKSTVITPTLTGFILTGYSCGTSKSVSDVFPNLIVGKTYVVSFQVSILATTSANNSIGFYNQKTQQLSFYRNNDSFTLTNEMYYERSVILYGVPNESVEFSNVQIEEGITATSYEPYKSNILTVNEEVELRGIGDVKDTLNLMTGEYVQRIGEVVSDGSEDWVIWGGTANVENISTFQLKNVINNSNSEIPSVCDKFGTCISASKLNAIVGEGVAVNSSIVFIRIEKSKLTTENVNGFKQWLSKNPITIKYQLETESIKTVDLSTLNQYGNKTKLKTFDDITHVSLSSEELIPEAEMTVATKNLDDISQASTMSLRMNDISEKQNELQNEVDTQSENIDSTMMATTEIYEQTL